MQKPQPRLLDTYRDILKRSRQLIELAQARKWEELIQLQTAFLTNLAALEYIHEHHQVADFERSLAASMLKDILDDWQTVRSLLTARRDELAGLLVQAKNQELQGGLGKIVQGATYGPDDLYRKRSR
jgi:hypothetical protein